MRQRLSDFPQRLLNFFKSFQILVSQVYSIINVRIFLFCSLRDHLKPCRRGTPHVLLRSVTRAGGGSRVCGGGEEGGGGSGGAAFLHRLDFLQRFVQRFPKHAAVSFYHVDFVFFYFRIAFCVGLTAFIFCRDFFQRLFSYSPRISRDLPPPHKKKKRRLTFEKY